MNDDLKIMACILAYAAVMMTLMHLTSNLFHWVIRRTGVSDFWLMIPAFVGLVILAASFIAMKKISYEDRKAIREGRSTSTTPSTQQEQKP